VWKQSEIWGGGGFRMKAGTSASGTAHHHDQPAIQCNAIALPSQPKGQVAIAALTATSSLSILPSPAMMGIGARSTVQPIDKD
jgi:hypothetical protein